MSEPLGLPLLEGLAGDAGKEAARLCGQTKGLQTTVSERDALLAQLPDESTAVQAAHHRYWHAVR